MDDHTPDERHPLDETRELPVLPAEGTRVEYTLRGTTQAVPIEPDFRHPVELRLGDPTTAHRCVLVHGREWPQLGADYIVLQPEVVSKDPSRGWLPVGGLFPKTVVLGREASPAMEFGADVSREHCSIWADRGVRIEIGDDSHNGTAIRMHPDDVVQNFREFNR